MSFDSSPTKTDPGQRVGCRELHPVRGKGNVGCESEYGHLQMFFCLACSCVHGRCNQGPSGDGSCDCDVGWRGVKCDSGKHSSDLSLVLSPAFQKTCCFPFYSRRRAMSTSPGEKQISLLRRICKIRKSTRKKSSYSCTHC